MCIFRWYKSKPVTTIHFSQFVLAHGSEEKKVLKFPKKSFNMLKKNKKRRKYSIIWIWMQQETLNPSSFGSSVNEFKLAGYCVIKVSYRYAVICLTKSTVRFSKPKWEKRLFLYKQFKREFLKILILLSSSSVLV